MCCVEHTFLGGALSRGYINSARRQSHGPASDPNSPMSFTDERSQVDGALADLQVAHALTSALRRHSGTVGCRSRSSIRYGSDFEHSTTPHRCVRPPHADLLQADTRTPAHRRIDVRFAHQPAQQKAAGNMPPTDPRAWRLPGRPSMIVPGAGPRGPCDQLATTRMYLAEKSVPVSLVVEVTPTGGVETFRLARRRVRWRPPVGGWAGSEANG
jgi:hypothetical protein